MCRLAHASVALPALVLFPAVLLAQFRPLECHARSGTPSVRAEGVAELVGDLILTCTGGEPTPADRLLPQVNIQIFTQPAVEITSRKLAIAEGGNFTEALLFIDEPAPAKQRPCGSPRYPYSALPGRAVIAGICGAHPGAPGSDGVGTYDPDAPAPSVMGHPFAGFVTPSRGNVYQARQAGRHSLIWPGVPFDPPGPLRSRVLRITNVRVNASEISTPTGVPATVISMLISTAGEMVLPIVNPAVSVAISQPSLEFSIPVTPPVCRQCESANADFFVNNARPLSARGTPCDSIAFNLRFTERFPSVFRRRSIRLPAGDPDPRVAHLAGAPTESQDALGVGYQTESGFYKALPSANWPAVFQNGSRATGPGDGALGLADQGTRLVVRFVNVPDGLQVWLRNVVGFFPSFFCALNGSCRTGTLSLIDARPDGSGPFRFPGNEAAPAGAGGGLNHLPINGGAGQATWEFATADTTSTEVVDIPVILAYSANPGAGAPSTGTATASGSLVPLETSASIPRFTGGSADRTIFTINACRTNILFPFVTNSAGLDTGLALANTSKDPYGTLTQTGSCEVNYFGTVDGHRAFLRHTSPEIGGGEHFVWSLSAGGAVPATPGFEGYLIARCGFQFGHGFAYLSSPGSGDLAMAYLGLVLDEPAITSSRSFPRSESLRR